MKEKIFKIILVAIVTVIFYYPQPSSAAINLIKTAQNPTIYYIDSEGIRHTFPNEITYKSWYDNFSKVITVSPEFLTNYPLEKNITIRPGTYLVKIKTDPKVYAVEPGGILRWLENEDIAEAIYGNAWQKKIVDIPEVFFDNYIMGETINHDYLLPDGIVYKNQDKYYYKNKGAFWPFKNLAAVLTNNYKTEDIISGSLSLYTRKKETDGFSENIFNPAQLPASKNLDCENKNLKAAFIFVYQGNYNTQQLENLELIKKQLPKSFSWASDELSKIDINYPLIILKDDGTLTETDSSGQKYLTSEVAFSFYDKNPDIFDFLIIYTNFKVFTKEIATFTPVTNQVAGINKALMDAGLSFGSSGKLKGVITMGNIEKYQPQTSQGLNEVENYLLHEILHHWGANIKFIDEDQRQNNSLLREPDLTHWSNYVNFISPLGGLGWQENSDGSWTSKMSQMPDSNLRKFSDLDLYLMGLLPARAVGKILYIIPENKNAAGNTIKATAKEVTMEQIIKASGKWQCEVK